MNGGEGGRGAGRATAHPNILRREAELPLNKSYNTDLLSFTMPDYESVYEKKPPDLLYLTYYSFFHQETLGYIITV